MNYDRTEMTRRLEDDMGMELAKAEAENAMLTRELNKAFTEPMLPSEWRKRRIAARTRHTDRAAMAGRRQALNRGRHRAKKFFPCSLHHTAAISRKGMASSDIGLRSLWAPPAT